ncbi:APO protein 2, chloroplastic-like protein [Drosera capensis]
MRNANGKHLALYPYFLLIIHPSTAILPSSVRSHSSPFTPLLFLLSRLHRTTQPRRRRRRRSSSRPKGRNTDSPGIHKLLANYNHNRRDVLQSICNLTSRCCQSTCCPDSLKIGHNELQPIFDARVLSRLYSQKRAFVVKNEFPQNTDLPRRLPKTEKKPWKTPLIELRRAARERLKQGIKSRVAPPRIGLTVKYLIPLAYEILNARITLINNLKMLLKVVPVLACKWCNEIYVGPVGHSFRTCRGRQSNTRRGLHEWTNAVVQDIFVPVDAFHLYDRLGKRILHAERFSIPRIPAVVELCIQAGVDIPEFPAKRRRKPIIRISRKEFIDADESELPDPVPEPRPPILSEMPDSAVVVPSSKEEIVLLAEETLQAWETLRQGAKRLMRLYPVRVCGYCPEIHIGPSGHKAQNCGARKHQQRNGQHGWQAAIIDDLIPPRYVWHVPDVNGPPLLSELKNFYGQAPAVVEMCTQAGAEIPEQYKPTMRLEVGIPTSIEEAEKVV